LRNWWYSGTGFLEHRFAVHLKPKEDRIIMSDKQKPQTPASPGGAGSTSMREIPGVGAAAGTSGASSGASSLRAPGQRWTAARKQEVVLRLLRGESLEALSRELGVEPYRLAGWREKALLGIATALKGRSGDGLQGTLDTAMQRIGELTMANELLWERVRKPGPLPKRRS
jgi:transposase-like protein